MPYNMHNIDDQQDGYCLLYYVYEPEFSPAYEIIPYCLRSFDKELVNINNTFDSKFTFEELREKNISSEMLVSWSSSIDLAEEYEIFLNNLSNSSSSMEKKKFFYNCSSPWFGPFCLFVFDPEIDASFNQIVDWNFDLDKNIWKYPSLTCYVHLVCERPSLCLDWREICDRKIDCLDGSDELNCWQLEMNECAENEYRCHNGQCISAKFFHDQENDTDCMDGTDEDPLPPPYDCARYPAFRCEESTCRLGEKLFPCGDGECTYGASSCRNNRDTVFLNDTCSKAMGCLISLSYTAYNIDVQWCQDFCPNNSCVQDYCSSFYEFPSRPIAFGHVRLVYMNRTIAANRFDIPFPDYICYDEKLCENFPPSRVHINGLTCHLLDEMGLGRNVSTNVYFLYRNIGRFFHQCLIGFNLTHYCNHSITYQCLNSTKCISKHRLLDGIQDCPFNDDEKFNQTCPFSNGIRRFNCTINNITNCYSPIILSDKKKYCQIGVNEDEKIIDKSKHIYFQTICDGIQDLLPELIDGRNETDETECENWPCDNIYTRCNEIWSCKDGADERNCPSSVCPLFEHGCVFFNDTSKVSCLPFARINDGIVDCLGATDERTYCRYTQTGSFTEYYRCWNDTKCLYQTAHLCNSEKDCPSGDDEIFCSTNRFFFCSLFDETPRTKVEQFFCDFTNTERLENFRLGNVPTYPVHLTINNNSHQLSSERKTQLIKSDSIVYNQYVQHRRCNRGIPIRIRRSDITNQSSCLCPPSYYGNECQYQNERVSLTLQIRVTFDWRVIFTFVITLIDNERNIQSYEQIEYLSIRDCNRKFHVYLLYSTRPKNSSKNSSIQIDLFNKATFQYRASWIFPIHFSFLPVYRQSVLLEVPISEAKIIEKCQLPCIHGKCLTYVNNPRLTFCQCSSGWSGVQCNIEYQCNCSSATQCIGKSICLCPIGRYGPRCYLRQLFCHSNPCINGGQCVTKYEQHISSNLNSTMCICPEKYTGDRCEFQRTRIIISFHKTINIPQWLLVHFIRVENDQNPIRTTIMKKIVYDQNSVTIYTSMSFNLAFVQILNAYYLIILREVDIDVMNISTMINPSYQCRSIDELFNVTIVKQHKLRRIKSYHIPCKEREELICFYDDIYFCLCNLDRQANCFEFTYNMTYDCDGSNFCENDGKCFEDNPKCPTSSICICPNCYYGSKCQFSTEGSTLSLDVILGYQIYSNLGINQQSTAVKVGISLSIITLVLGLISSLLSLLTFQMKKTRDVGCGLYLLTLSIVSMITMIVLFLKFWFLLGFQMSSITDRSFLNIQCMIINYFLRFLLSTGDWLSACVAMERTMKVLKGIRFSKKKSKQFAKWVILFVFILTISTYIHDPMHRVLIDDKEEQRTWCVTTYSSSIQKFDWAINILHFSVPFLINLSSSLIIIISTARIRLKIQKRHTYRNLLREQMRQYKHLLISPFILFVLVLPRLIISFASGCMKSARNPWLFLIGYFILFTPSMLTFFVFVLPSKSYKREFIASIQRFWKL